MIPIQSIEENSEQIIQDIENKTNQTTPAVPFAYNKNLADAMSAQAAVNKLHNVDQRNECFVDTASEFVGLPLLAGETNTPRNNGNQTILTVSVIGENGVVIGTYNNGPEFVKDDVVYQTIQGATIAAGVASINVQAKVTGSIANLQNGDEMTLSSTFTGIDDVATVTDTVSPGTDQEDVEDWRQKIKQEKAFPSTVAGTTPWFARISQIVPGITAAYPYSSDDIGKIDLFLAADAELGGVPPIEMMDAVVSIFKIAPYDCLWSTLPDRIDAQQSVKDIYGVQITQGSEPITQPTRDAITASIEVYFENRKPFIEGLSLSNTGVINKADIFAITQNIINGSTGEKGIVADVVITAMAYPAADIYIMPEGLRAVVSGVSFV